jgi:ABC-type transporter Mla subunit MlaD
MPAKGHERRRTLLGSLLILAIIAGALAVFFLDDFILLLERRTTLVATLPDAPRLTPGAPVWIAGQHVGEVVKIEFREQRGDPDARVALTLEIPRRLFAQLPAGTHVRITAARLIGEPVVDIVPGPVGGPPIAVGDTLDQGRALEFADVIDRIRAARADFGQLAADFAALSASPALREGRLRAVQQRFAAVSRELEALRAASADGSLAHLLGDPGLRGALNALSTRVTLLRGALGAGGRDRADEAARIDQAFDQLATRADSVAAEIARISARADAAAGTLPRFGADSALTVALLRVRAQLDSLIQEARSHPLRFVF